MDSLDQNKETASNFPGTVSPGIQSRFDDFTYLAVGLKPSEYSLIVLKEDETLRALSSQGVGLGSGFSDSFYEAVSQVGLDIFQVEDAGQDSRFQNDALVLSGPKIRFFAGICLTSPEGEILGLLCVMDPNPGRLDERGVKSLQALGRQVSLLIQSNLISKTGGFNHDEAQRTITLLQNQQERMRRLYEITSDIRGSLSEKLDELLKFATDMLGYDTGIISHIRGDDYALKHCYSKTGKLKQGQIFYFHDTYCELTYQTDGVLVIDHMGESRYRSHSSYKTFAMESYTGIPVYVEGYIFGTLNFCSDKPREQAEFPMLDQDFLKAMGHWVGAALERAKVDNERKRLITILEAAPELVAIADFEGDIQYINAGGKKLLDPSMHNAKPRTIRDINSPSASDFIVSEAIPAALNRGTWTGESTILDSLGVETPVLQVLLSHYNERGALEYFSTICHDITQLKDVERMKNDFVSTVSHELRTPLTSIRGALGLLVSGALDAHPEKVTRMLTLALNNSERLIRLINDILDIEKMESGKMDFRMEPFDLVEVIEECVLENKGFADQYSTFFTTNFSEPKALLQGDRDRIRQVLDNLISNALKYTEPTRGVEIGLEIQLDNWRVSVRDHGPGIPKQFHQDVFNKFAQADSSSIRGKSGTGLGLSIAQYIAQFHGGRITFDSQEGLGTVFYLKLPCRVETEEEAIPAVAPPEAKKVLLCEDDESIAQVLKGMLEHKGFQADTAHNEAEAWDLLEKNQYSALAMDIKLGEVSGLDLLREIRRQEKFVDLPVVMISLGANQEKSMLLEGEALGIVDWLAKPFDEKRLLQALRSVSFTERVPRILYVENDADLVQVVRGMLGPHVEITWAATLREGINILLAKPFNLILLDMGLPDGSGLEFLEVLNQKKISTPVLIFTGREIEDTLADQVDSILMKSRVSLESLSTHIANILDRK